MKVVKYITSLLTNGTKVYYITGNHDEMLRKFKGFRLGSFEIVNKLILDLDGQKAWFFHGDVFDVTMQHSKWLAKLGGVGYDLLIMINTLVNWVSQLFGFGKLSLSKKVKNSVKGAVKFINNFEQTAADIAIDNHYDYVICGHIHQPQHRVIRNKNEQEVLYLNSGDWIDNLTALECKNKSWSIYKYEEDEIAKNLHINYKVKDPELVQAESKNKDLFNDLLKEFEISNLSK